MLPFSLPHSHAGGLVGGGLCFSHLPRDTFYSTNSGQHVKRWSEGFTNITHLISEMPGEDLTITTLPSPGEETEAQGLRVL